MASRRNTLSPGKSRQAARSVPPEKKWQQLADRAYKAWRAKNYDRQEELLKLSLAVAKTLPEGDYRLTYSLGTLGDLLLWKNKAEEALPLLKEAVEAASSETRPNARTVAARQIELANCYQQVGKLGQAYKCFEQAAAVTRKCKAGDSLAVRHDELLFYTLFSEGSALMDRDKYARAVPLFKKALKMLSPHLRNWKLRKARVTAGLAVCLQKLKREREAIAYYRQAARLHLNGAVATTDDIKYLTYYLRELGENPKHNRAVYRLEREVLAAARKALKDGALAGTKRRIIAETMHKKKLRDPYRWLESLSDAATQRWIDSQCNYSELYLASLPGRLSIANKLLNAYASPTYGVPVRRKEKYFFSLHSRNQPQTALYVTEHFGRDIKPAVPTDELVSGENRWITRYCVSPNGRYFAYGVNDSGSDWQEWKIYDLRKRRLLAETLTGLKDDYVIWNADSKGFFYVRFSRPRKDALQTAVNRCPGIFLHLLGTEQDSDKLIYRRPDRPDWYIGFGVSTNRKTMIIGAWHEKDTNNRVFMKKMSELDKPARPVFPRATARYLFIEEVDDELLFITDLNAPRRKLIAASRRGEKTVIRDLIPESNDVLLGVVTAGKSLVVQYLSEQHSVLRQYTNKGRFVREFALPFRGTISDMTLTADDRELFVGMSSFTEPETIFRLNLKTGKFKKVMRPRCGFDGKRFVQTQVAVAGHDGTQIPMLIVHRKNLPLDGKNPTMLVGYGGFNVSMTPSYSYEVAAWLEMGGVYALPALRGGGELGSEWHKNGSGQFKQNTFDDFIASAQWLIDNRYTSKEKLAISGSSNGGLTVGAVVTQRPDLFGAVVSINGLFDMLRFHLSTLAWTWHAEFGRPAHKDDFDIIYKYSPYHRIEKNQYPPMLLIAGEMDDRVMPWHSYKFAASLQHAQKGKAPILLKVERNEGHGGSRPSDRLADQLVFLAHALKIKNP